MRQPNASINQAGFMLLGALIVLALLSASIVASVTRQRDAVLTSGISNLSLSDESRAAAQRCIGMWRDGLLVALASPGVSAVPPRAWVNSWNLAHDISSQFANAYRVSCLLETWRLTSSNSHFVMLVTIKIDAGSTMVWGQGQWVVEIGAAGQRVLLKNNWRGLIPRE